MTKAITLWQPWASAIPLGCKTIETRGWSTSYRGELLIHAAATDREWRQVWDTGHRYAGTEARMLDDLQRAHEASDDGPELWGPDDPDTLPLGAVVAIATLTDVVPIGGPSSWVGIHEFPHEGDLPHQQGGLWLIGSCSWDAPRRIEHERPWGDYTPGRYGWLLTDIRPLTEPVACPGGCCKDPAKHFHQGLWTPPAALTAAAHAQTTARTAP